MRQWQCEMRRTASDGGLGFGHCGCARFDDGSCVPSSMYPEFARRRDAELPMQTRDFAKRELYPADMFPWEKLRLWPGGALWIYVTKDVVAAHEANGGHPGDRLEAAMQAPASTLRGRKQHG